MKGMFPLAIATGAGNEILQPLAIVVFGGLFTNAFSDSRALCPIWETINASPQTGKP